MSGGYSVVPGLYRVPDLLTEEQFVDYMKRVYNVDVSFTHTNEADPTAVAARALGQSHPMGVVNEDGRRVETIDPVLAEYNSMPAVQTSTDKRAEKTRKKDSSVKSSTETPTKSSSTAANKK